MDDLRAKLADKFGAGHIRDVDVLSAALYPKVLEDYQTNLDNFGEVTKLPTRYFLKPLEIGEEFTFKLDKGNDVIIRLVAVGPVDPLTNRRDVFFLLNGETRVVDGKVSIAFFFPLIRIVFFFLF
jgi:pyruvate carboxylase